MTRVRERTTPVRGAPCWMNLVARDLRATKEFYSAVLGWSFHPVDWGEEFAVASVEGQPVAGISALATTLQVAVAWTPYFAVDDADDTAGRVRERSATVAVGPLQFGSGRAALAADRDGAVFGFWEGRTPPWSVGRGKAPELLELRTRDALDAAIFYGEIFNWASGTPGDCEVTYQDDQVVVSDGTHTVAALRSGGIEAAPDPTVRPRWGMQLQVEDVNAVSAAAVAAGGKATLIPPTASAPGSQYVIRDPDGALFTVTDTPPDI